MEVQIILQRFLHYCPLYVTMILATNCQDVIDMAFLLFHMSLSLFFSLINLQAVSMSRTMTPIHDDRRPYVIGWNVADGHSWDRASSYSDQVQYRRWTVTVY